MQLQLSNLHSFKVSSLNSFRLFGIFFYVEEFTHWTSLGHPPNSIHNRETKLFVLFSLAIVSFVLDRSSRLEIWTECWSKATSSDRLSLVGAKDDSLSWSWIRLKDLWTCRSSNASHAVPNQIDRLTWDLPTSSSICFDESQERSWGWFLEFLKILLQVWKNPIAA